MSVRFLFLVMCLTLASGKAGSAAETLLEIVRADRVSVLYDAERLESLPQHEILTHTSVTDGVQIFVGPLMRDVLAEADLQADGILAVALNDYEILIPTSDFDRFDVIAALTMNGQALTPRDKGPIWIVYPRDDLAELQDIRYDYRWVWQLIRIEAQ